MNELLDIVNEYDHIIGQKYRTDIYEQKLSCFRVINAFLINSHKQLWIPRRTHHKKLFPLCLDASVGGHVMAGESYEQAFERELREELNLEASHCTYEFVAKLTPHGHKVSAFMHLYLIHTNVEPEYNKDDFESAQWYTLQKLQEMIKNGAPAKSDLLPLIAVIEKFLLSHDDFYSAQQYAYRPSGLLCKNFLPDSNGQKYGGGSFEINNRYCKFRVGKITPKKIGQFVTLWKRPETRIVPYDMKDTIDFFVIHVRNSERLGQFVFPKSVLYEKGYIAHNGNGGKLALRVYPPWDKPNSLQAQKTQEWQCKFFFEITKTEIDSNRIKELFS